MSSSIRSACAAGVAVTRSPKAVTVADRRAAVGGATKVLPTVTVPPGSAPATMRRATVRMKVEACGCTST
jgi:hypothetical protein